MRRHRTSYLAEAFSMALGLLPGDLRRRLENVSLFEGDPVFAGLHHFQEASFGRSYRDTAHVAYPFHQPHLPADRRETTLVFPEARSRDPWSAVGTLVHELGHVLDEQTGFSLAVPGVTEYGETDRYEAVAEAFQVWVWGPQPTVYEGRHDPYTALRSDGRAIALFEELAYP